ncbi:hypothetical protein I316_03023 [Kwoniella heveanensis BCC8398]|uniref:Uncharacterized protein n=1 Tax=Kwoniella heveanensis BCC8398 TaxID=1296120 RepID=A0A1B9GWR0_9TREE|nr:hypothetical protein I316_03023 [Kwoniella heveanensis BCC8398]
MATGTRVFKPGSVIEVDDGSGDENQPIEIDTDIEETNAEESSICPDSPIPDTQGSSQSHCSSQVIEASTASTQSTSSSSRSKRRKKPSRSQLEEPDLENVLGGFVDKF